MAKGNGRASGVTPMLARNSDLFAARQVCRYNEAEQEFSLFVEKRLEKLLKGEANRFLLLRRYHQEPGRLGAPVPVRGLDQRDLRLPVVEEVLTRVLIFLQTGMPGGPVAQESFNGLLVERQLHTTRFPHILIERVDTYEAGTGAALETEWIVKRMQNQHFETRLNRALDVVNLGLEFFRAAR